MDDIYTYSGKAAERKRAAGIRKEPFDIVYSSVAATVIKNLDDESYSITPELRLTHNSDDALSEYGEKPSRYKWEVRLRYYF